MTEKDRYGETLKKREKAEEDRYMAEQDRIRLERLRAQKQREEAPRGACPACGVALEEARVEDTAVSVCPRCRGAWLSADALKTVVGRAREGEIVRFFRGLLA